MPNNHNRYDEDHDFLYTKKIHLPSLKVRNCVSNNNYQNQYITEQVLSYEYRKNKCDCLYNVQMGSI